MAPQDMAVVEKLWYLGTIMLKKYYIVLDMSPYDEGDLEYIQVGIAPINPVNNVAAAQYNSSSSAYSPDPHR